MLKNKRFLWIVSAVVFVLLIFLVKNDFFYSLWRSQPATLVVSDEKVADLVNKDTDGDTVPDWEEKLWGTDPTKADTNGDGIGDAEEIAKLQKEKGGDATDGTSDENLTTTDRFSRELFSTVAALNESGQADETTLDKLSVSLAGEIQTSPQTMVYNVDQLKVSTDNTKSAIKNYNNKMGTFFKNLDLQTRTIEILQNSVSEEQIDEEQLAKLDPIIIQVNAVIKNMLNIPVPSELKFEHLEMLNSVETINENLRDISQIDKDVILTLKAVSQYGDNLDSFSSSLERLKAAILKQLNK